MGFRLYGATDIGCAREANEDSIDWLIAGDGRFALAILADGMGGYKGGEIASQATVACVRRVCADELEKLTALNQQQAEEILLRAGKQANQEIFQQRMENPELSRMGTTLVVALAFDKQLTLLHAGDSRCYKVASRKLEALTRDHSMVQQMLDGGVITETDVDNVPFRNMLTRAVGVEQELEYAVTTLELEPDDQFLLCSDGLFNALNEQTIHTILQANDEIGQQVHKLIEQSLVQQASDNVSAILLYV